MSNLSLISLNVYITIFSKAHFVRKIDFYSVENCEPLLFLLENIFIAFGSYVGYFAGY